MMEPDGHFVLVELSDGRAIADLKLDAETALADILVVHSGQQYLLLTAAVAPPRPYGQELRAIAGVMTAYPIQKGRMVSFDEAGKLLWPAAVTSRIRCSSLASRRRHPQSCSPANAPNTGPITKALLWGDRFSVSISDPGSVLYREESKRFAALSMNIVVDPQEDYWKSESQEKARQTEP